MWVIIVRVQMNMAKGQPSGCCSGQRCILVGGIGMYGIYNRYPLCYPHAPTYLHANACLCVTWHVYVEWSPRHYFWVVGLASGAHSHAVGPPPTSIPIVDFMNLRYHRRCPLSTTFAVTIAAMSNTAVPRSSVREEIAPFNPRPAK